MLGIYNFSVFSLRYVCVCDLQISDVSNGDGYIGISQLTSIRLVPFLRWRWWSTSITDQQCGRGNQHSTLGAFWRGMNWLISDFTCKHTDKKRFCPWKVSILASTNLRSNSPHSHWLFCWPKIPFGDPFFSVFFSPRKGSLSDRNMSVEVSGGHCCRDAFGYLSISHRLLHLFLGGWWLSTELAEVYIRIYIYDICGPLLLGENLKGRLWCF